MGAMMTMLLNVWGWMIGVWEYNQCGLGVGNMKAEPVLSCPQYQ
jgi:hypothetical protein